MPGHVYWIDAVTGLPVRNSKSRITHEYYIDQKQLCEILNEWKKKGLKVYQIKPKLVYNCGNGSKSITQKSCKTKMQDQALPEVGADQVHRMRGLQDKTLP